MGLFDYVQAQCPDCNATMHEQTKFGECSLRSYDIEPIMRADEALIVDGISFYCDVCKVNWEVRAELSDVKVTLHKY